MSQEKIVVSPFVVFHLKKFKKIVLPDEALSRNHTFNIVIMINGPYILQSSELNDPKLYPKTYQEK